MSCDYGLKTTGFSSMPFLMEKVIFETARQSSNSASRSLSWPDVVLHGVEDWVSGSQLFSLVVLKVSLSLTRNGLLS